MGKLALMAVPAASLVESPFAALAQTRKPNSVIGGVSIGTITYSYRSMPDQSAEATLRYQRDVSAAVERVVLAKQRRHQ